MEKYLDIKDGYLTMKAANSTLKSLIDKVDREICLGVYEEQLVKFIEFKEKN